MNVKTNRKKSSGPDPIAIGFTEGPVNCKLQSMGKGSYVQEAPKQKK